jgi:hypothetical protein
VGAAEEEAVAAALVEAENVLVEGRGGAGLPHLFAALLVARAADLGNTSSRRMLSEQNTAQHLIRLLASNIVLRGLMHEHTFGFKLYKYAFHFYYVLNQNFLTLIKLVEKYILQAQKTNP